MSYDLTWMRLAPGQSPDDALEQMEQEGDSPPSDEAISAYTRLTAYLRTVRELSLSHESTGADRSAEFELVGEEFTGMQVLVTPSGGGMSLPFARGAGAPVIARRLHLARAVCTLVRARMDWVTYDGQIGRVLAWTPADLREMTAILSGH